jgi:LysM repeat protein
VYYGKQNNPNGDYYNNYRRNSYKYNNNRENYLLIFFKILVIILLLGVLFFGYLYILKRDNLIKDEKIERSSSKAIIKEDVKEKIIGSTKKNLSQEDIANIVRIVMNKLNKERRSRDMSDDDYTKELLLQDNSSKSFKDKGNLKDINHYNKVFIKSPKDDIFSKLSLDISSKPLNRDRKYTKAITKEIATRSNEMRIIVVKAGDSLSKIAKRAYGDYESYVKILEANPEIIKNPNEIYAGQRLRVPL